MFLPILGLLAIVQPVAAILCDTDQELDYVQEFSFNIGHDADDLDYWRTYHNSFFLYGEHSGNDAVINAGYYTKDGDLIYSIKLDCAANTWTSYITKQDAVEEYLSGELETSCQDGDIFDLIFKVEQPRFMNWIYDAQALGDPETQTTEFRETKERQRIQYVKSQYKAHLGWEFKATISGSAAFTRFAFGKCTTWPESLTSNCTDVANYLLERSKGAARLYVSGNILQTLTMKCVDGKPQYYQWLQTALHPDKESKNGAPYCCCVNMETGALYEDDKDKWCTEDYLNACTQLCLETYQSELIYGDSD